MASGIISPCNINLDEDEGSVSRLGHFTNGETARSTNSIGDCVGTGAGMDVSNKRKIPFPCQEKNGDYLVVQPVA
jgi:hypothetical protein